MGDSVLKILTINVWSGLDYDNGIFKLREYETQAHRKKRYQILVKQIQDLAPDVIALNEANPLPGYVKKMARDLNYDYIYHVGLGGIRIGPIGIPWNLREGDAVLARKPLRLSWAGRKKLMGGWVTNLFSFHWTDTTQIIAGLIRLEDRPIFLFNTHWHAPGPYESEEESARWREEELKSTFSFIKEINPYENPAILMGDFNGVPSSPQIERVIKSGWIDTYAFLHPDKTGGTWDEKLNRNIITYYDPAKKTEVHKVERLDYIFVNSKIGKENIIMSDVVFQKTVEDIHASDHFGVYTSIKISL